MVKNSTIIKNRYDKTHMKQFLLKFHLANDADVIEKLSSVPNMQGYVRQLVRQDLARTDSVNKIKGANKMKTEFINRIISERIVDTKQYRYMAVDNHNGSEQWTEIRRIQIENLDTIDAINGWETVKIIK